MADIVINPAVGKIDFFAVKGDNVTNTLKLTGNTLLVTGPLSASSISTGGGGAFVTSAQPTSNFLSKFTGNSTIANSLIYDNGTNVGVGTTSPADKFHVIGNVRINGGDILNWSGQAFIQTLGNYDMFFRPNSTLQMILTGNGNLGIGSGFTNPLAKLHVTSATSGATLLRADGTNGTLFSVVDDLSDSLMSVNNSAGLPVFEVFADDRIVGGQYGKNDFVVVNNKLGIGTNNPTAKLQVTSSVSSPSAAFLGGNVGIGTTNPIYSLDIPTITSLTRVGSVLIGSWPTTTSLGMFGNSALDQTNAANYALLQSNQGITYLNAASGQSLRLRIANTDRLIIDSGGNVGIGTTSFVYGSANRGLVELYGSSDALLALRNSTGNLYIQKTSADVYINNTNSGIMSFATSNAQRMVIFSGGSVSFGSAADLLGSPGNIYLNGNTGNAAGPALAFGQSDSVTGGIGHLARITGGGTSQDIFIQSQGASNSIGLNANPSGAAIYFQTQGAEKARITAAGNLGIGTSTPATKVDIYGPVSVRGTTVLTTNFDLNAGNAADIYGNIRVLRGASLNDGMYIGYGGAGGNLKFFSNSGTTEFMTIATTGNVGIGSTSPAAKLDIAGTNTTIALSFGTTVPNNPLFINTYGSNTGIGMDQATAGLRLVGDYSGGTNPLTDIGYYTGGSVSHANWISRFKVVNSGATVFTSNVYHSIGSQRLFAGNGGSFNYLYTGTTALNFINAADTSTLMTLLNGGSVGIGTTSPTHKLEVLNTANSATYVRINNQNTGAAAYTGVDLQSYGGGWQVRVPASTIFANSLQFSFNDAERVRITYDGNVGIGTTSPVHKLQLGTLTSTSTATPETLSLGGTYSDTGGSNPKLRIWTDGTYSIGLGVSSNQLDYILGRNIYDHVFYAEGSRLMTIKGGGNVGIGTSTPRQILHINGSILLDGLQNGYEQGSTRAIGYGSNSGAVNTDGFSGMDIQSVNAPAPNGGNYSQNVRFWTHHYGTGTGNTPRMILQYNGNVGIGTTSPIAKLEAYGGSMDPTLTPGDPSIFSVNSLGVQLAVGRMVTTPFSVWFQGKHATVGGGLTYPIVLNPLGGNVGIGTTSPGYKLEVTGTGFFSSNLTANGVTIGASDVRSSSNILTLGGTSERIRIDTNGNVGIGTTSPTALLHVNGTTRFGSSTSSTQAITGSLNVTGSITLNTSKDSNWPFLISDPSTSGGNSRYQLGKVGAMGFNYADSYAQLQLIGANGAYIDFGNASGDDMDARIFYVTNTRLQIEYGTTLALNSTGLGIAQRAPLESLMFVLIQVGHYLKHSLLIQMVVIIQEFVYIDQMVPLVIQHILFISEMILEI